LVFLLDGTPPKELAPLIFKASKIKNRMVRDALEGQKWVVDIDVDTFMVEYMEQCIRL
jgi:hypothetical protein